MKKIKVAIVGCGMISGMHISGFLADKACEISHLYDVKLHLAKEQKERFKLKNTRVARDFEEILESDCDIVSIAVPDFLHKDLAIQAAKAGKAIYCEKPLALDVKSAREMVKAVEKYKVPHAIGLNYRYMAWCVKLKEILSKRDIGQIYNVFCRYAIDRLANPALVDHWRVQKDKGGLGVLADLGSHMLDLTFYLTGESDIVHISGSAGVFNIGKREKVSAYDVCTIVLEFKNGMRGIYDLSRVAAPESRFVIDGEKYSLKVEGANVVLYEKHFDNRTRTKKSTGVYKEVPLPKNIPTCHAAFVQAVRKGKPFSPSFYDGLKVQEVLEKIDKKIHKP